MIAAREPHDAPPTSAQVVTAGDHPRRVFGHQRNLMGTVHGGQVLNLIGSAAGVAPISAALGLSVITAP
ncbi:hypothetical protein Acsp02_72450 [Actinoplanes sp. NBRC 103695]|nr:hypothetical protein Acsp02_72450 [Actinoplanes sp. NBRC 103695]